MCLVPGGLSSRQTEQQAPGLGGPVVDMYTLEKLLLGMSSVQQQCKTDWENDSKTDFGDPV